MRSSSVARRAWLPAIVAAVTVMILLATTIPAEADVANNHGHGTGTWLYASSGASTSPPCGEFTAMTYKGTFEGRFNVPSGPDYEGPVTIEYTQKSGEKWYANPGGTYAHDPAVQCSGTAGHEIVLGNVNITGSLAGNSVACSQGTGDSKFGRVLSDGTAKLKVNCVVNGVSSPSTTVTVKSTNWVCAPFPPSACATTDEYTSV